MGSEKSVANRYRPVVRWPRLRTNTTSRLLVKDQRVLASISATVLYLAEREGSPFSSNPALHSGNRPGGGLLLGLAGGANRRSHSTSLLEPPQGDSIERQSSQGGCSCWRIHSASQLPLCSLRLPHQKELEPYQSFLESISLRIECSQE